ncbi:hypothetical protein BN7_1811 [Wickerhamomyces ciferrii]|uniref:Uncharacterized protein n=1 Tax=Wickerhamomyces ciferrii (strain ATCC 14091 / BCRC 22168 / CBS 111 / JCM 3599 / NBRC 0793 / NRRL Y-1031 F-60-10) TaxID=1206466 RepID=K0KJI3_WICCF|nr:uncharacterized protein BN7_1811 [Wickerhamomyces ciferrii]CCH42267.1 hypothetical protein BN7_1811 [Wickerhamomyces ciferrii]
MSNPVHSLRQPLSENETQFYGQIFKSLDPESLGIVTGDGARSTFEKSGLPPAVLGEIWQLADPTNLGFLSEQAFAVALRLIGHVQNGAKPDKSLIDYSGPIARIQGIPGPTTAPTLAHTSTGSISSPQSQPIAPQYTSLPPLTNHDISKFGQLFHKSAPSGIISGEEARNIFLKARLPTTVLSEIWALSDKNNRGKLDRDEFIVAMFLIQGTINNTIRTLPPKIPQNIWDQLKGFQSPITTGGSFGSATGPYVGAGAQPQRPPSVSRVPSSFTNASNDWVIAPQKRQQFDALFEGLDKDSKGVLGPNEVAPFLMTSKLPQDVLANIWDLSDIHNTGEFTKTEFAIAMFLVQKKVAGVELPNVIPDSLLDTQAGGINTNVTGSQPYQQQAPTTTGYGSTQSVPLSSSDTGYNAKSAAIPQIPSRDTKPKSSLTDLVDLNDAFTTPSPSLPEAKLPEKEQNRTASSSTVQYTPSGSGSNAPKPFVPSSSFGQDLFEKQKTEAPKEGTRDFSSSSSSAPSQPQNVSAPAPQVKSSEFESPSESRFPSGATAAVGGIAAAAGATIGAAVGAVSGSSSKPQADRTPSFQSSQSFSQQPTGSYNNNNTRGLQYQQQPGNNDLLADSNPEISGQLSQATSDMANLSNQIGSLANQTSQLHDKRGRAEQELAKITNLKKDIEAKLTKLRAAYDQEVQQTEHVQTLLKSSKEETEQLRKEASVAEAQYNSVQTQLQGLQSELEESQKENASLKERLGTLNAEHIEAQKQLEKVQSDVRQSKGLTAINSKQLSTTELSSKGLKEEITALLASVKEIDTHHETFSNKQRELENLKAQHESNEKDLAQRKQLHEQNESEFRAKDEELQSRLQEQQEREHQISQHENHIQQLFANLQERKRQLDEAEHQLQQQQVEYAQRVQSFSSRQLEDASTGYAQSTATATGAATATSGVFGGDDYNTSSSRDLNTSGSKESVPAEQSTTSSSSKGLIGAAVGAVAGAIGGTAVAATNTTTSEKDNAEFDSPIAATTEQTTSVNSDDYQYEPTRDVNQFNLPIDRPESTTSSIQNNAPQSVRGDDIEENPTIDSVVESPALASDVLAKDYNIGERRSDATEIGVEGLEPTGSPDAGSFEVVENVKSESDLTLRGGAGNVQRKSADDVESSIPGGWNVPVETPTNETPFGDNDKSLEASQTAAEAKIPEPRPSVANPSLASIDPTTQSGNEAAIAAATTAAASSAGGSSDVGAQSFTQSADSVQSNDPIRSSSAADEEFPPIKELDINESESDDEEFHETSENLPEQGQKAKNKGGAGAVLGAGVGAATGIAAATISGFPGFSSGQQNQEPTLSQGDKNFDFESPFGSSESQSKPKDDLFQDDFEGLEAAKEGDFDEDEFNNTNDFNEELEGSNFYGAESFSNQPQGGSDQQNNGEWEQIFAGFGNAPQQGTGSQQQSAQPNEGFSDSVHPYAKNAYGAQANTSQPLEKMAQPEPRHPGQAGSSSSPAKGRIATTPKSLAVQELTGMGFSKDEALNALTKEKWNLEAATNFLLDNA